MTKTFEMYLDRYQHLYDLHRARIKEPDNIVMRLHRLEKPEPWSGEVLDKIFKTFPEQKFQQYPNFDLYYSQLSQFIGVPEDRFVITSGIDETIKSLMTLCCEPGDKVAVTWPGYAMYEVYAKIFGVELVRIICEPEHFMLPDRLIENLSTKTKVLFLPNPGQPVENCFDIDQLRQIAEFCEKNGILFVVDEAYYYFGSDTALSLTNKYENLLVLRTFSKAFGAASLRVGYASGSERAIKPLMAFRMAGEASTLALHAMSILIQNFDQIVIKSISDIIDGRNYLRDFAINELNLPAWGNKASYVLLGMENNKHMANVVTRLERRGIYVKGHYPPPLDKYILVTCGARQLVKEFAQHFKDVLKDN